MANSHSNYYAGPGLRGLGQAQPTTANATATTGSRATLVPMAVPGWVAPVGIAFQVTALASAGALAYHGYKRNGSVGWALVWGLLGGLVWPVTVPIALAQGYGKPRGVRKNRGRRSRRRSR